MSREPDLGDWTGSHSMTHQTTVASSVLGTPVNRWVMIVWQVDIRDNPNRAVGF